MILSSGRFECLYILPTSKLMDHIGDIIEDFITEVLVEGITFYKIVFAKVRIEH